MARNLPSLSIALMVTLALVLAGCAPKRVYRPQPRPPIPGPDLLGIPLGGARVLDRGNGDLRTSLNYPGLQGQSKYVDAEKVPYFVLPMGFAEEYGLVLGDIGAVIKDGRVAFGIYADNGPTHKLGEVSIKLAENLGHAPWKAWDKINLSNRGGHKTRDVHYLVFPGSRPAELHPDTINAEIERIGQREFSRRGGQMPPPIAQGGAS